MEQQPTGSSAPKNTSGIIIAVIITAIIVGVGVYWWQQSTVTNISNENTNQTSNLNTNSQAVETFVETIDEAGTILVEVRDYGAQQVYLLVATEKFYPDGCYFIQGTSEITDKNIKVTLNDIRHSEGICTQSPEEASIGMKLDLEDGTYTLELHKGSQVDSYTIEVSDNQYTLKEVNTSFSRAK